MFIMNCFHPTLRITKSFCRAVPPTCTNIGFSTGALTRGDRIWRIGTTKFSCSHPVTWSSISRDARQATVQGNHQFQSKVLFHAVGQEKKGLCIGSKQESIFESEAWTYISCSRQNTIFCVWQGFIPAGAPGRHETR